MRRLADVSQGDVVLPGDRLCVIEELSPSHGTYEEQGIVYVSSTEDMVKEIISLLKSTEYRQQVEQAGLNYVKQVHGYDMIAQKLELYLEQAIEDKKK